MPDPSQIDIERYWDGERWTGRTRDRVTKRERIDLTSQRDSPRRERTSRRSLSPGRGGQASASGATGRRIGVRLVATVGVLGLIALPAAGYLGRLPGWVPWPAAWMAGIPEGPAVAYPVFGSDETVTYLARSMVAQRDSIDVSFLNSGDKAELGRLEDALAEVTAQNPYVFTTGVRIVSDNGMLRVEPTYTYSDADAETRREATRDAVAELVTESGAAAATTDAARAEALHDAIAAIATYDFEAFDAISAGNVSDPAVAASQEAFGILVNHTAVCNGYAKAFQLGAQAVGLESVVVTGQVIDGATTGLHAWNRVKVDGVWRVVDVTWDDIDAVGESARKDYLLVPDGHPLLDGRTPDAMWIRDEAMENYL